MDKKTLGAGIGIGILGTVAVAIIAGAGDPMDLSYDFGGHEIDITQEQFDALVAAAGAQEIIEHENAEVFTVRAHTRKNGTHYAVVQGRVTAPADDPPEGKNVRVSAGYVEAIRKAKAEALPE